MDIEECDFDLIDPCPDVHALFVLYNGLYFEGKLGACSVEWSSKRMTLCAGVCSYRPGGGCIIKLSRPLLELRPTVDLKETLLHEMIHAYHFLLNIRDNDKSGHGDKFKEKMNFINRATVCDPQRPRGGYNVTIYHTFHAEVDQFRRHWWQCEKCSRIVKRSMNRPPQNADCPYRKPQNDLLCNCAHHAHMRNCGGEFKKIKEPENFKPKESKAERDLKKQRRIVDFLPVVKDQQNRPGGSCSTPNLTEKSDGLFVGKPNYLGQEPKQYFPGGPTTLQDTVQHLNKSLGASAVKLDKPVSGSGKKAGPGDCEAHKVCVAAPILTKRKADAVEQVDLVTYDDHKASIQKYLSWKNQQIETQLTRDHSALPSQCTGKQTKKSGDKDVEVVDLTDDV